MVKQGPIGECGLDDIVAELEKDDASSQSKSRSQSNTSSLSSKIPAVCHSGSLAAAPSLSTLKEEVEDVEQQLYQTETIAHGTVAFSVYKSYFAAAGGPLFLIFLFLFMASTNMAELLHSWWLKEWIDNIEHASKEEILYYLSIYAAFGASIILTQECQLFLVLYASYKASVKLHLDILSSVLSAPLRFFETTPAGRILNRFTKDVEQLDTTVMTYSHHALSHVTKLSSILFVIAGTSLYFLPAIPFLVATYCWFAFYYLATSRQLKRIDSVTRSPLYSQFTESLQGADVIRAFQQQPMFRSLMHDRLDSNHQAFFYLSALNQWFAMRAKILSAVVIFLAALVCVFGGLGSGWSALVLTFSLQFTLSLEWAVKDFADIEMGMNAVERILEYGDGLDAEPEVAVEERINVDLDSILDTNGQSSRWPTLGKVVVENLSVRYASELPNALSNVSFSIPGGGCKLAVCGRTGSGKSTLSLAFFRILQISGGFIEIDGIDISKLPLKDLRSHLTIIPQDPIFFQGTLRSNLDPLGVHTDADIWSALSRLKFRESCPELSSLDSSTLSSSLSQGQKQLLALCRAFLSKNKVIILDEASASCDMETDQKIQIALRSEFTDSTVVCIAHRLRTIIDYDYVLVLDKGKVAEFGPPGVLLSTPGSGIFDEMCRKTGEYEELLELAKGR